VRSVAGVPEVWSQERFARLPRALGTGALALVAVVWTLSFVALSAADHLLAWDVRFAYLPAAHAVVHGVSPFPRLDDPILYDQKGYVYPPQLALALLPLTVLPVGVAALVAAGWSIGLVMGTLRLLGVRDWRCYAAAFLWMPTMSGVLLANVSIPLAFAAALVWRYRNSVWPPAVTLGLAVSAKFLLWPLLVWTLATRRIRATVLAVVLGLGVTVAAWAILGFEGLTGYPALLRKLNEIQAENSYSLVGMASSLGLGVGVGDVLTLLVGGALLVGCVVFARRRDEERSFTCAVAATLALTPIVWLHYFVLLLVPTAIARPRFSALWLLPALLWVSPRPGYPQGYETFMPGIVCAVLIYVLLTRPWPRGRAAVAEAAV
jgi:alpha-1,2-mannosyltransferase